MNDVSLSKIETIIYFIRGQKVMLDSDLARLYEVETKVLNRQVTRHSIRFPADFMFRLTMEEHELLRCQIGTSNEGRGGRRYLPNVFTLEQGTNKLFKVVFERLDRIEDETPILKPNRKKIGLKLKNNTNFF
jgi:hypothetical protein